LRFVPLAELENWRETEMGWSEREPRQGFSVDFFQVSAAFREVGTWVQPLVNSATEGQVILACRERGGLLEFFLRPVAERGLATAAALAPSYVRYPGAVGQAPAWLREPAARIWSHTIESDEGGRFYRDASAYQIVRTDAAAEPDPSGGAWLRLSEMKMLLRSSNVCTIQLRGIVSHLLGLS
jgi:oxidase EvaA